MKFESADIFYLAPKLTSGVHLNTRHFNTRQRVYGQRSNACHMHAAGSQIQYEHYAILIRTSDQAIPI